MKEETKMNLYLFGLVSMMVGLIACSCMLGAYFDTTEQLEVNLKNVGSESLPFTLYIDGEVVLTGTILPNETVTYRMEESFWVWGESKIFTCSVQLPNTIYEREVRDGTDEYFLFD